MRSRRESRRASSATLPKPNTVDLGLAHEHLRSRGARSAASVATLKCSPWRCSCDSADSARKCRRCPAQESVCDLRAGRWSQDCLGGRSPFWQPQMQRTGYAQALLWLRLSASPGIQDRAPRSPASCVCASPWRGRDNRLSLRGANRATAERPRRPLLVVRCASPRHARGGTSFRRKAALCSVAFVGDAPLLLLVLMWSAV